MDMLVDFSTCLGQEPGVVHPHTVHAILVHAVEVSHFLAVHVQGDAGVPGIGVLVKPVIWKEI
eukprot:1158129-Pelagomonas_calceolata.AAC.6